MLGRLFAASLLIVMLGAVAEAQFNVLHGYIIIPTDRHSDDYEVLLTTRDGEQVISHTNVGMSGEYMFTNVNDDYLDVLVRLDGFRESRTPVQLGNPGRIGGSSNPFHSVNIILIPDPESRASANARTAYSNELLDEYGKALDEIGEKHPELALPHLAKVMKEVPDFYDGHLILGLVYEDLQRGSEAEKEFLAAHELNTNSARPLVALGRLFLDESGTHIPPPSKRDASGPELIRAREVLTEATMLDAKLATGFYYLGIVDFLAKDYTNAEKELKRALELAPNLEAARIELTNVYLEQKLWETALDNLDAFLVERPSSPLRAEAAATRALVVRRLQPSR